MNWKRISHYGTTEYVNIGAFRVAVSENGLREKGSKPAYTFGIRIAEDKRTFDTRAEAQAAALGRLRAALTASLAVLDALEGGVE